MRRTLCGLFLLCLAACTSDNESSVSTSEIFAPETTEILYEVDYMTGAEPYVGNVILTSDPIWIFLKNNVSALFDGTKTITVPTALEEMQEIPAENKNYTQDEILSIADTYRDYPTFESGVATLHILFFDGYFEENGSANRAILGVSFGDTGVIAIFKPAIETRLLGPLDRLTKFIEQTVLIHESGHALGLVNNGLELTSDHQDSEHGAHCTNDQCVMYYLNEGAADLIEFLQGKNPSVETVIFGQDCLNDALAAL